MGTEWKGRFNDVADSAEYKGRVARSHQRLGRGSIAAFVKRPTASLVFRSAAAGTLGRNDWLDHRMFVLEHIEVRGWFLAHSERSPCCIGRSLLADGIRSEQQNRSEEPPPQEESAHRPEGAMRRFKLNRLGDGSGCRGLGDCLGEWRASALPRGRWETSAQMTYQRPTAVFNIAPAIS